MDDRKAFAPVGTHLQGMSEVLAAVSESVRFGRIDLEGLRFSQGVGQRSERSWSLVCWHSEHYWLASYLHKSSLSPDFVVQVYFNCDVEIRI